MSLHAPSTLPSFSTHGIKTAFRPKAPVDLESTGLSLAMIEGLILKYLTAAGLASGRRIAEELGLPFGILQDVLRRLKETRLVSYENTLPGNDFEYRASDTGRDRAMSYARENAYIGTAPVPYKPYLEAVAQQTINNEHPKESDLRRAFSDLLVSEEMFKMLGPAINSGRGMFLYGPAGNGKTSIAERITRCFGTTVWIPKVLLIEGQIVKLFDPVNHEPVEEEERKGSLLRTEDYDKRWIHIRRPTLVAGGELTMENLEIHYDAQNRICEAPLQMKSNMGTLLIDDFGRQRMPPIELLNRWIVPLEKRYDFLKLPNGKVVRVPFDQLILFSTNLEPKQLVDEAFLRRIPYKIEAKDPTEPMFRKMIEIFAPILGFKQVNWKAVDYLIATHYTAKNRPMRACQPRDLLLQIRNYCIYHQVPLEMTEEYFDHACKNYFTVM